MWCCSTDTLFMFWQRSRAWLLAKLRYHSLPLCKSNAWRKLNILWNSEMSIPYNQSRSSQWARWISVACTGPISLPRWKLGAGEIGAGEIPLAWLTKERLVLLYFQVQEGRCSCLTSNSLQHQRTCFQWTHSCTTQGNAKCKRVERENGIYPLEYQASVRV